MIIVDAVETPLDSHRRRDSVVEGRGRDGERRRFEFGGDGGDNENNILFTLLILHDTSTIDIEFMSH